MAPISSYTEKQVRDLIKTSDSGMPYPTSTAQSTKNQTVDHTGVFRLNQIGKHVYAYSGALALDNTTNENTYLEFTTGNYYLVGTLQANNMDVGAGTDDMFYQLYMNGSVVLGYIAGGSKTYSDPDNLLPLVIPPRTAVKVTVKDLTQASTIKNTVSIIGRIYEP